MSKIHLIVGPVGAGKSTFALKLAKERRAVRLILDEWMMMLFRPDRPDEGVIAWYVERTYRCLEVIWKLTENMMAAGTEVVLEIGLIQKPDREQWYRRVDKAGYAMAVYVLDAPRDIRRERVERRNVEKGETFSIVVPPDFFEFASDLWETPEAEEAAGREMTFIFSDS